MATITAPVESEQRDALVSLVEAERLWAEQLAAAHAEAERILREARAAAARAADALAAELLDLTSRRRLDLQNAASREREAIRERYARRTARYRDATDANIRAIALDILRRIPWVPAGERGDMSDQGLAP